MMDDIARDVLDRVTGAFAPRRRRVIKPNRCLGCGRVTRHVFCPDTYAACRAMYERKGAS